MNKLNTSLTLQTANADSTNAPSGILQRRCDCGKHTVAGGKCNECVNKKGALQRKSSNNSEHSEAPPIVHEVLNSSGQPLDKPTRAFFESRFEHNFSQVPISSVSQQLSQSSLTVGEPADAFEQEADRIADSVIASEGQNNEQGAKFDLSRVRIHTNARAAASARAINAQAYTFGHNIVFGTGQFAPATRSGQHLLAHELAHVAQQTGSGGINIAQRKFIQRKKVPSTVGKDDFGQFETTTFTKVDDAGSGGVEIELKFHPNKNKADAKKIALTQSVKTTKESGAAYALDPNSATRMVPSGKTGAGYYIDQLSDLNTPIYTANTSLGATEDLKDTPSSSEIGSCYKVNPTDAEKTPKSASMWDKPRSAKKKGRSKTFETAALAIDGADSGKYYGSVSWGYKIEGTAAAPTVTIINIKQASKGKPTANFLEAAKLWNVGKTRGTLEIIADPEAEVLNGTTLEKLPKGTKLTQVSTVVWKGEQSIEAEVLKSDGTGSGKIVTIKNADVKDTGSGSPNKKLPIP